MSDETGPPAKRHDRRIPPVQNRYKPGTSGNPRGRPKRPRDIYKVLESMLSKKVPVTNSDGTRSQVEFLELIFQQLLSKSAKGDLKATALLFKLRKEFPDQKGLSGDIHVTIVNGLPEEEN